VIVIAGFPRFEARQAHYAERTSGVLSNQIGALLLASGATELNHIRLGQRGSARVELTAIWVLNSVKSLLTLSPYRASSEQIVVLWPENCDTPNIDWSAAWHHSNIEI